MGLPAGPRQRGHDRERGEFGAVTPRPPREQDRGGVGELAGLGVDDHHGLQAGAADPPGVPAHPAVASHGCPPGGSAAVFWAAWSSSRR